MASLQQYLAGEIPLWFQRACGEPLEFLGCHNLTGVSVPRGDTNPIYCRVGKNKFEIQRTWRGAAGLGSATLVAYDTILNELQEMPCAFNLYAMHAIGGKEDDFTNYDYFYMYEGMEVTSEDTDPHSIGISPDDQATLMLNMPATFRARSKVKELTSKQINVSSLTTADINSIAFCDVAECDILGNLSTLGCKIGLATTNGPTAILLRTTDGGSTWVSVATPFTDASHAIGKIICSGDVSIVLNTVNSSYAYSWDAGLTWTEITTPARVLNSVFFISSTNIWFVGDDGYIYQSVDRGGSVSLVDAGQATSSTLLDVSFSDSLLGYACGEDNAFVRTVDGGAIWTAVAGPAAAIFPNDLYRVTPVFGTDIVFVGDEQGNVYRSSDQGANWTTSLSGITNLAGGIRSIVTPSCNVIGVVGNDQDPYFYSGTSVDGFVYQSIDGGNSWLGVTIPANDGVNDMIACGLNRYWLVGEAGFLNLISGQELT